MFDSSGALYQGDVNIDYRRKHPVLVNDTDRLLFPASNFVALSAVMFMLRQTKYDVDAQRLQMEYEKYKRIECKQDAKYDVNLLPRDTMFRTNKNCKRYMRR